MEDRFDTDGNHRSEAEFQFYTNIQTQEKFNRSIRN